MKRNSEKKILLIVGVVVVLALVVFGFGAVIKSGGGVTGFKIGDDDDCNTDSDCSGGDVCDSDYVCGDCTYGSGDNGNINNGCTNPLKPYCDYSASPDKCVACDANNPNVDADQQCVNSVKGGSACMGTSCVCYGGDCNTGYYCDIIEGNDVGTCEPLPKYEPVLVEKGTKPFKDIVSTNVQNIGLSFSEKSDYGLTLPTVYSLSVNADIEFNSTWDSLARIILVDKVGNEFLIFEGYSLLIGEEKFSLENFCEETCNLEGITPDFLKIQAENAEVKIESVSYSTIQPTSIVELKSSQEDFIIGQLNKRIGEEGMVWVAGDTGVSGLDYGGKSSLFGGESPNLRGFEYYKGGVFEFEPSDGSKSVPVDDGLPDYWVWTDNYYNYNTKEGLKPVHGQNWVTPVKFQGTCGSCTLFGIISAIEQKVNVYYNNPTIDLDLSEQEILSCDEEDIRCVVGASKEEVINYIKTNGVVNEACFPYRAIDETGCSGADFFPMCIFEPVLCSEKCDNFDYKLRLDNLELGSYSVSEDDLKKEVISGEGTSLTIWQGAHVVHLVGYKKIEEGDMIFDEEAEILGQIFFTNRIESGSPLIGKTEWIIKNSFSELWGENGYGKLVGDVEGNGASLHSLITFEKSASFNLPVIQCTDNDEDGYCFWGLSNQKSSSCNSLDCNYWSDFDDGNSGISILDSCSINDDCAYLDNSFCYEGKCVQGPETCESGQQVGDANNDGVIDELDATIIHRMGAVLPIPRPIDNDNNCCVDVDSSGFVEVEDAQLIYSMLDGWELPEEYAFCP